MENHPTGETCPSCMQDTCKIPPYHQFLIDSASGNKMPIYLSSYPPAYCNVHAKQFLRREARRYLSHLRGLSYGRNCYLLFSLKPPMEQENHPYCGPTSRRLSSSDPASRLGEAVGGFWSVTALYILVPRHDDY